MSKPIRNDSHAILKETMALTIIKLGGSIITHKHSGQPVLRLDVVRRLARELASLRRSGRLGRCILLHGAGSFGHPTVFRHRLDGRRLSGRTVLPVSQTIRLVDSLTELMTEQLLFAGLPVVPLHTTSIVTDRDNRWRFHGRKVIQQILRSGAIPMLSGQLVISDDGRSVVLSADRLAVIMAKLFRPTRIIFCTDVDGVYDHFPPRAGELPVARLDRLGFSKFIRARTVRPRSTDVAGSMVGKLRAIMPLTHGTIAIINGFRTGRLSSAFDRQPQGTVIRMDARKKKPSRRP